MALICTTICICNCTRPSQAPPANLQAEGFPPAVCNQGEGGGELYNRASGVRWSASSGDKYVGNLNLD